MKMGVVVDATCDLAHALVSEQELVVLPAALVLDRTRVLMDDRDPANTLRMYRRYLCDRAQVPGIQPMSAVAMRELFLNDLVLRYDRILVLCMDTRLGEFFDHATQASYGVLKAYRQLREDAGLDPSFAMRVLDTGTVGPGEGVLADEAVRALHQGQENFDTIRRRVQAMAARVQCRLVPADLSYLQHRRRGDGARMRRLGLSPRTLARDATAAGTRSRTLARHRAWAEFPPGRQPPARRHHGAGARRGDRPRRRDELWRRSPSDPRATGLQGPRVQSGAAAHRSAAGGDERRPGGSGRSRRVRAGLERKLIPAAASAFPL